MFVELTTDAEYLKVAFTKADGETELYAEKELFDVSEELGIFHVSNDGWTINANTSIFLYYDADHADNTDYIGAINTVAGAKVWDDNYKFVCHMVNDSVDIDIGNVAADRPYSKTGNVTYIDLSNAANATGKIKKVQIYAEISMASAKVATFYNVEGNNYSARDVSSDLGVVTAGGVRTFDVDLDVVTGDFIGIYFTDDSDAIDAIFAGYTGVASLAGDQTSCSDETFDISSGHAISLYGYSGLDVFDSTSNNNDGIKKDVGEPIETADGKVNSAQRWDGNADYINYGSDASLDITGNMTYEALVYRDVDDVAHAVGGKWLWSAPDTDGRAYYLQIFSDNNADFFVSSDGTEGNQASVSSTTTIDKETFFHIAGVYDGTNIKMYVDGAWEADTAHNTGISEEPGTPLYLGVQNGGAATLYTFFDGVIDEVRLSSTNRSVAWLKGSKNTLWDALFTYGSEETEEVAVDNSVFFGCNF